MTDTGKVLHIADCQHLKKSCHEMRFCKACMPQGLDELDCKIRDKIKVA